MGELTAISMVILMIFFAVLAILHFSWALGIKWGLSHSIPTNLEGERIFNPTWIESGVVGIGLFVFATLYYLKYSDTYFQQAEPHFIFWIIPGIFLIRLIGEFKYVGLFKTIRHTTFGKTDSRFILPLCALIVLLGVLANLSL